MGISVSFYNKATTAEDTHTTYSTMHQILLDLGLVDAEKELRDHYGFQIPAGVALSAMEKFLHGYGKYDWKEVRFVRQIVMQYNDYRKEGHKPRWFGGA
jgi:hypothetical protein